MPTIEIENKQHEMHCGLAEHQAIWRITKRNLFVGENVTGGINPDNVAAVVHAMTRGSVTLQQIESSFTSTKKILAAIRAVVETINDGIEEGVAAEENPSRAA